MIRQIFVGLFSEGSTDNRFLESVVTRTFEQIGFECFGEVETEVKLVSIDKTGKSFSQQVIAASKKGVDDFGISILCVHTDADYRTDVNAFRNKINPAIAELQEQNPHSYCQILTAIVPVQMIEAWMLADRELLKSEIGTDKSDVELGINRPAESLTDPKLVIETAIRTARLGMVRRRRRDLTLGELYLPIGQKIKLESLQALPSFLQFKDSIRTAYRELNYMQ